ncbi:MAG: phosphoribosylaminoimidazole-succinocarboxamide synthase [Saprospiraceae bacterium]|jgi:phosphoribosylaminoimidazole-succinocarboxamide synthase
MNAIAITDFNFPRQTKVYNGKVRDVYFLDDKIVMVATDRISAFDHILPRAIPYKGQVLNQVAKHFLDATSDIVPNWLEATPDPNVAVGRQCEPIMLEMVVRGYMAGHAWRTYNSGERILCGEVMLEGLKQNDRFPRPLITPATKAEEGHDEDISKEEILKQGIVTAAQWDQLEDYTLQLFWRGTEMAAKQGLILVDTKYEFGLIDGEIILMDEIHTPDSSRYFYADGYEERQANGEAQKQLSKEFVREWLMDNGFQGQDGQTMPEMPDDFVNLVSERYIELYEVITGKAFERADASDVNARIEKNVGEYLKGEMM